MSTPGYPHWIYDDSPIDDPLGYGERAVRFLKALKHPKNLRKGNPFVLDPWQERIVRRIYGPRHDDGTRIVRTVVLLLPRGNRKTALSAALALLHTLGPERVPFGEVLSAAADRKQARIGFAEALSIIRVDKRLQAVSRVQDGQKHRITNTRHGCFYEAISADAGTQHGRTPVFVLADELHAWKKRDLWDVLRTGLTKTKGALLVVATTAGCGQENVAFDIVDYARKVATGEIDDPATLPILFAAHRDADWKDEALWYEVNPGLKYGYPDLDGLRQMAREAQQRIGDRQAFRQLHLNIWLDNSANPFVDMLIYDKGNKRVDLAAMKGTCWLAVDLSSNSDLTVIIAAWLDGDGGYVVYPWFFCPADNLARKAEQDGAPYPLWAEKGFITPTPGNVVDFRAVEAKIRELCEQFDVREIAFDPHLGRNMMANLADDGLPAVEMRQGWVTMAPAIKELERAIISSKFQHGGHPVLRWNFDNIAVATDPAGNMKFNKGKSRDRIDGAVAAAMAVGRASHGEPPKSVFDSDDFDAASMIL